MFCVSYISILVKVIRKISQYVVLSDNDFKPHDIILNVAWSILSDDISA